MGAARSSQAEHIEHVVHAASLAGQEPHGAQAALGVSGPAGRFVRDLYAFAGSGKEHRMVTHDVAPADGGKPNRRGVALAGHPLTGVHRAIFQVPSQGICDHFAHFERGTRGCIDLVAVMGFHNFDVKFRRIVQ